MAPRNWLFAVTAVLVFVSVLIIAMLSVRGPAHFAIGLILGTMFAQTTLAAAWSAFGPLPLLCRLPLSLIWISLLVASLAISFGFGLGATEFVVVTGGCLFGQWFVVQIPFWGLAVVYGWQVRHREDDQPVDNKQRQFGIRQLMIFTAIVAMILGIGRLIAFGLAEYRFWNTPDALIMVYLAGTAILMTLPLVLAGLLQRHAVLATLALLVLIGLATFWEMSALQGLGMASGPDQLHLILINLFSAAWIVAFMALLRRTGYGLARQLSVHTK